MERDVQGGAKEFSLEELNYGKCFRLVFYARYGMLVILN